jgi:hypothetical protein
MLSYGKKREQFDRSMDLEDRQRRLLNGLPAYTPADRQRRYVIELRLADRRLAVEAWDILRHSWKTGAELEQLRGRLAAQAAARQQDIAGAEAELARLENTEAGQGRLPATEGHSNV